MRGIHCTRYHIVFATKYRRAIFFTSQHRLSMQEYIIQAAQPKAIDIINMEVCTDHVHLLVSFPPSLSISSVVQQLKGSSSRRWFEAFPDTRNTLWGGHLWSPSYYVGTLGDMSTDVVQRYINNQLTQ